MTGLHAIPISLKRLPPVGDLSKRRQRFLEEESGAEETEIIAVHLPFVTE
jgi:hypothetical protein